MHAVQSLKVFISLFPTQHLPSFVAAILYFLVLFFPRDDLQIKKIIYVYINVYLL